MERKDGTTTNYKKKKQPLRNQAEQSAAWLIIVTLALSASGSHFILLVAFKVHGSSLNMWDAYVSEYADGQKVH